MSFKELSEQNCVSILLFFLLLLLHGGCTASKGGQPASPLDTPERHVATGDALLRQGDAEAAIKAYQRALQLDPRSVGACTGTAKVSLLLGAGDDVVATVNDCLKLVRNERERLDLLALRIRGHLIGSDPAWLNKSTRIYDQGMRITGGDKHAALQLAMGLAWDKAGDSERAVRLLASVVELGGVESAEATQAWKRIQMVDRASSGSYAAREIAVKNKIGRAEMAALLVQELDLYKKKGTKVAAARSGERSDQGLNDYDTSPFSQEILLVNRLGLRGMEIRNGSFEPERPVNRAEMALMLEDLLVQVGNVGRTDHLSGRSSFPDLASTHFAYNALMTSVTRGLMEGESSGNIRPFDNVTGAEALLAVRRMKELFELDI